MYYLIYDSSTSTYSIISTIPDNGYSRWESSITGILISHSKWEGNSPSEFMVLKMLKRRTTYSVLIKSEIPITLPYILQYHPELLI